MSCRVRSCPVPGLIADEVCCDGFECEESFILFEAGAEAEVSGASEAGGAEIRGFARALVAPEYGR